MDLCRSAVLSPLPPTQALNLRLDPPTPMDWSLSVAFPLVASMAKDLVRDLVGGIFFTTTAL